ncbi:MAG: peptide chain release factor N(5)-glutamine methyltransferase [Lutibacter sp.]|uniref:peptide chain release factor N(5)-glutamine methyltransferase n=1 Tax=Lutibacter sp. TaxID=1925666 RepID=UPI00299E6627|nr:peptide chain release factor N(5)-glutamine methyltransferase [Lutibacter sp.]MDX1829165.1 peptide chain release factor N(5)-glutamine methyltransferase [Lutibacter sp.]
MNIIDLKNQFFTELKSIYPETEILSFFNLLINFRLKLSRTDIALNPQLKVEDNDLMFLQSAIKKLQKQQPIQYIIGETDFFNLTFKVNPNVLIPRPETEELVEWVLSKNHKKNTINILDIGTGSGCIAISLAKNLPNANVYAIDISPKAINTAAINAKNNNVNINFIETDILKISKLNNTFDIIVSNPPYVRELEKTEIQQNVLANEPHLALFVKDQNPLLFYNKIADLAKQHLTKDGNLFFEINQYLSKETLNLLKEKGFKNIELRKDIFKNDRMIKASL